jgi:hypothetical protein
VYPPLGFYKACTLHPGATRPFVFDAYFDVITLGGLILFFLAVSVCGFYVW